MRWTGAGRVPTGRSWSPWIGLTNLWAGDAAEYNEAAAMPLAGDTSKFAEAIQQTYVAVLLLGPKRAWVAADAAREAAWAINDRLSPPPGKAQGKETLPQLVARFKGERDKFKEAVASR
jgi:hypothetical protein